MYLLFAFLLVAHGFLGLQRELFINEVFTLLGFIVLLSMLIINRARIDKHLLIVLVFIIYGLALSVIGFTSNIHATVYEKLRTLPILYSAFCFYFGYYLAYRGVKRLVTDKVYRCAMPFLVLFGAIWGPKITQPTALALSLSGLKSRKTFYSVLIGVSGVLIPLQAYYLSHGHNTLTMIISVMVMLLIRFYKDAVYSVLAKRVTLYVAFLALAIFVYLLNVVAVIFSDFYTIGYGVLPMIEDPNSIWRLMFWAKSIHELEGLQWIYGIGLGTPIFDETDPSSAFIVNSSPNADHRPYTLGLHNSFITFFIRFGLVGVFLLLFLIFRALRSLSMFEDTNSEALLLTIILVSVAALFNVVLESALFSGLFWAVLGVSYRHIHIKQREIGRIPSYLTGFGLNTGNAS